MRENAVKAVYWQLSPTSTIQYWLHFVEKLQVHFNSWDSLRHHAVNLGGTEVNLNRTDAYVVLEWHVFASKTQGQHIYYKHAIQSDDCLDLEFIPTETHEVT